MYPAKKCKYFHKGYLVPGEHSTGQRLDLHLYKVLRPVVVMSYLCVHEGFIHGSLLTDCTENMENHNMYLFSAKNRGITVMCLWKSAHTSMVRVSTLFATVYVYTMSVCV